MLRLFQSSLDGTNTSTWGRPDWNRWQPLPTPHPVGATLGLCGAGCPQLLGTLGTGWGLCPKKRVLGLGRVTSL